MCTVSFVKSSAGIIITSNRDEQVLRSAEFPQTHLLNGKPITFPKDPMAGGTWFALAHESGRVAVLLNGAETRHQRASNYRKSRGLVLLDLVSAEETVYQHWKFYILANIEPFTLIVYENQTLLQLRWDGIQKSAVELAPTQAYIWSSATLYSAEVRAQRENWFNEFLNEHACPTPADLLQFHQSTPTADKQTNILMERSPDLKTISITQVLVTPAELSMHHSDLLTQQSARLCFDTALI